MLTIQGAYDHMLKYKCDYTADISLTFRNCALDVVYPCREVIADGSSSNFQVFHCRHCKRSS